jgi:alanyl-tRNA synthetase
VIKAEEDQFSKTLDAGIKKFKNLADCLPRGEGVFPAQSAFLLADTFGFPVDLTQIMAEERGQNYTRNEWKRFMNYTRNEWKRLMNYTRNEWKRLMSFTRNEWKRLMSFTRNEWKRLMSFTRNEWKRSQVLLLTSRLLRT